MMKTKYIVKLNIMGAINIEIYNSLSLIQSIVNI